MTTRREQVLSAVYSRLGSLSGPSVLRNEVLPTRIPEAGVIILRDGDPGEPDVTLNPRTEYYSHRIPIEVITSGSDSDLDTMLIAVGQVLPVGDTLGGLAEMLTILAPEVGATPIEGSAAIRHAVVPIVVEYQVTSLLASE